MGLLDRAKEKWRTFREEWRDTPAPEYIREPEPRDPGVCSQFGCTEPAVSSGLCRTHAATIG